ncbi:MAG: glycerate kinase [Bacteroidales bacterium]|nr:glycerate kinase [Bacteroidales bacterium]
MKIIIAPDTFKECLPAGRVADILADELSRLRPGWTVAACPLSDGGEGFAGILTVALGGELRPLRVTGPLGEPVGAYFGRAGETGVIEVASACGLGLVPPGCRDPWAATSRGVGELLLAAASQGCRELLVGLGGSATCDGGAGMLSVPGIRTLCGRVRIRAFCDVDNPFVGPEGAARVFAPQKGADAAMVERLEVRMAAQAAAMLSETGTDVSALPGAGAAGGLAGALHACLGAEIVPGIDGLLDAVGFDRLAAGADWILTGEGRSDRQTLSGKVPFGVLRRARGVPVALLSGRLCDREMLQAAGFASLVEVTPPSAPLPDALRPEAAEANLRRAVADWLYLQGLQG